MPDTRHLPGLHLAHALALLLVIAHGPLLCVGGGPRETVALDGAWQIAFDPQNQGRSGKWYIQEIFERLPGTKAIQVPSCWETIEQDYEGAAIYARRFAVPAAWKSKSVRLQFGAVNYRAEVWINDQPAGFHEGGYTPFEIVVGDLLKPGAANFIAVRVLGPVLTRETILDGIGPNETPHWRGAIAGGIWQSVRLLATGDAYVADLFVKPDLSPGRAAVSAAVENASRRTRSAIVEFTIDHGAGSVRQEIALRPGRNSIDTDIPIPNARLWTPDAPHLYSLGAAIIVDGAVADRLDQRFGMREFTISGHSYFLNGKKIYLKAGFWEAFYPHTLAFPANEEIVRREIRLAKEAGFNVLRPWRKPPPPMVLDIADEMGIMLIGAPPIECMRFWPQLSPETEQRVAVEIREMILRDRNHPSLVYWELFNEIAGQGLARLKHPMSLLARGLDPSRIVIDESGGWADGAAAYPPHAYEPVAINEVHSYLPAPVDSSTYDFYLRLGTPGGDSRLLGKRPLRAPDGLIFLSEVGYGGLPDLPANAERYRREGNPLTPDYRYHRSLLESIAKAMHEMRWEEIFSDVGALCRASQRVQAEGNKLQLEAVRLNPRMAGYCIHAYTDGDWVLGAGLLDLFREPKLAYQTVKRVQAPVYLALQVSPPNFREGQGARLAIRSVNEGGPLPGRLEWELAAPDGQVVHREQATLPLPAGIGTVLETSMPALHQSGVFVVRAKFQPDHGGEFVNDETFFHILQRDLNGAAPSRSAAGPTVEVIDPGGLLTAFLANRGIASRQFTGGGSLPVVVTGEPRNDAEAAQQFARVMQYAEKGGTAVFLKPPVARFPGGKLRLRPARGHWVPVNHGVRPHSIFDGLPARDFMGQVYREVCARETIVGVDAPPIVGSLSLEIDNGSINRNYLGLRDAWWGADMVEMPHGKGRILLSTLRLLENLDKDPVAEKLLYNILRWAQR